MNDLTYDVKLQLLSYHFNSIQFSFFSGDMTHKVRRRYTKIQ